MTSVVKESLYDGNFLDTKHQSFESYVPVISCNISAKSSYPKTKDKKNKDSIVLSTIIDSDFRIGLIVKQYDKYFINMTPSCNIHKIKENKIEYIQLLELINYNTDLKGEHIYSLQPYQVFHWMIDFTKIHNIRFTDIINYEKVTILVESVAKDVQQKFSSFYSRQGSIDFH